MCERMAPHHRPCTVGGRGGGRRVRAAGSCSQHLCPPGPVDCPVRRTKGGCCEQRADVEGQQCDPDGSHKFYGRCGERPSLPEEFGCEVSSYPLPNLNWRKTGSDHFLPGDDPHISVQV
ncbi:kazal-type serine protease inhibitor domain-containing protein 1-like [Scophthalmus maximus]|uniref:kazal-type serine protease inhibitor domain-containing protein 1-like n=1 Tax=Scophthalmus maximus TaxID=52904 RepID=UPI001FA8F440|nr:kazal-type serine protease inhibitor domain-containing protein 1-like [Scophthalmus maximus]